MHIHWPLVVSTTCQRVGLGMYLCALLASAAFGLALPMNIAALATLVFLGIGGIASIFHLQSPSRFFNAFSNLKSHLTQEAIITPLLGIALVACGLNGLLFDAGGASVAIEWVTGVLALAFLVCTGLAYQMRSRPAWNTPFIVVLFLLTAAEAGSIATVVVCLSGGPVVPAALSAAAVVCFLACVATQISYTSRMRTVGYGVNVDAREQPYRTAYITWIATGVAVAGLGLAAAIMFSSLACAVVALVGSAAGIAAWTVLFFKGALKVKMFPMYPVDLNLDM